MGDDEREGRVVTESVEFRMGAAVVVSEGGRGRASDVGVEEVFELHGGTDR